MAVASAALIRGRRRHALNLDELLIRYSFDLFTRASNLASNQIEQVGGRADRRELEAPNLISLSLKGNPLRGISSGAFGALTKLKTL